MLTENNMGKSRLYWQPLWLMIMAVLLLTGCTVEQTAKCQTEEFAFIGNDGNVYLYDLCRHQQLKLTDDAPPESYGLPKYGFYNDFAAWSSSRNYLLVKIGHVVKVIDVNANKNYTLGYAKNALWSPTGKYLALYSEGEYVGHPLDGSFRIIDLTEEKQFVFPYGGNGPAWLNDDRIIYWRGVSQDKDRFLSQQAEVIMISTNLSSLEKTELPLKIRTSLTAVPYTETSRLAPESAFIAVYNPGLEGSRTVSILPLLGDLIVDTTNEEVQSNNWWKVAGSHSFQWSPVSPVLGICTVNGNSDNMSNIVLIQEGKITPLKDTSLCAPSSQISWSPDGGRLAYWNAQGGVSIATSGGIKIYDSENVRLDDGNTSKIQNGPWWSPDGTLIAVIADGQVCLANVADEVSSLKFSCVIEGSEIAWRP
jgi:hypothetical protein